MKKTGYENITGSVAAASQIEELDVWEYYISMDGAVRITPLRAMIIDYGYRTEAHLTDMQGQPYNDIYVAGTIFDKDLRKAGRFYFKDNSEENIETLRALYLDRAEKMERKASVIRTTAEQMHIMP